MGRALNRIVAQNAVLSPDGRALATTGQGEVELREFPAGRELRKSGTRDQESYQNLAFSPDGTALAAIGVKHSKKPGETPTTAPRGMERPRRSRNDSGSRALRTFCLPRPCLLSRRPDHRHGQSLQEIQPDCLHWT